jgi:hypothetical protein
MEVMRPGVEKLLPLVVTVNSPDGRFPPEDTEIRQSLDEHLSHLKGFTSHTVANTIFPQSLWSPNQGRAQFYERYRRLFPTLKKADIRNINGLYFQRLIAYGENVPPVNQLEHIISTYHRRNHRATALQASVFDVTKDHTHQRRRGFPCLQHVSFTPHGYAELAITGYYTSQYLFERAYGNYLGLWNLGTFMAREMGLRLTQMNCVAAQATRGDVTKRDLQALTTTVQNVLSKVSDVCLDPRREQVTILEVVSTQRSKMRA